MIFVFSYTFTTSNYNFTFSIFAAGCPLSYRQLHVANGKNPVLWYKKRKNPVVQKLFHLLLYPLGYNRARKNFALWLNFFAGGQEIFLTE